MFFSRQETDLSLGFRRVKREIEEDPETSDVKKVREVKGRKKVTAKKSEKKGEKK